MWTIQQATPCSRLNQTCLNVGGLFKKIAPVLHNLHTVIRLNKPSEPLNLRKASQAQTEDQTKPSKTDRRPKRMPSSCKKSRSCPAVMDRSGPRSHRASAKGHSVRNWRRLFANGVLSPCLMPETANCLTTTDLAKF